MTHGKMNFLHHLSALEQNEPSDASFDFEPPPLKMKNFGEAIQSLEDVQTFLDSKGHGDQATKISSAVH